MRSTTVCEFVERVARRGSPDPFNTGGLSFRPVAGESRFHARARYRRKTSTFATGSGIPPRGLPHRRRRSGLLRGSGPFTGRPTGAQAGAGPDPAGRRPPVARRLRRLRGACPATFGENFFIDVAARYEHYDDFGGELTGKLSARYEFTPAFALRGSVSNNFRAPSLSQIGFESTSTGYDTTAS